MTWQADGVKKVKKRTYILASCMFCFSMLLFSRMVYLQVIEGQKYQTLADKNRIASRQIASYRGLIVDRNGENLASNRISFRAIITAEDTEGNVQNVLDNVPEHTACAFILPDKKLEKDSKGKKLLQHSTLLKIIKLPEKVFSEGVTTSIFIFESGIPHENKEIFAWQI